MTAQFPNQSLAPWQIFSSAFQLWPQVFKKVLLLTLIGLVLAFLPYFIIPELNTSHPITFFNIVTKLHIEAIVYFLIVLIFIGAVYRRAYQELVGMPNSFWGSIGFSIKKLWALTAAMIVTGVMVSAGMVVLIIPGLVLLVIFSFYMPLIIVEDLNPVTAFKRCVNLIWDQNNWWRTAVVVVVPTIIYLAICTIIDIYGLKVFILTHPSGHEIFVFNHLSKIVLGALYLPFFATLLIVQLKDLQLRERAKI